MGNDLPSGTFVPHSKFETVVNFINNFNEIVFITSNENLLAANGIFLPQTNFVNAASLTISPDTINLDNVRFDRDTMNIYEPDLHYRDIDFTVFESNLLHIPALYLHLFPEKSLIFLLNSENEKFFTSGFDRQFMINAKNSTELILSGEIVKGIETIRGTGYGLTPSGDDFIAGFLLGIHYNECKYKMDFSALRDSIYDIAAGRNQLINSFLLQAKKRKYSAPLKKILLLLCGASHSSIGDALKGLLSTGATSGADLFSGYIFPIKHKTGIW